MSAETLLSRLEGVRKLGPDRWLAKCPAHEDKHPSMNIRELPDGKVLVVCRAGCSNDEIIAATGLHWTALFPAPDNTHAEYRREVRRFPAADVLAALDFEALVITIIAGDMIARRAITEVDYQRLVRARKRIEIARRASNGR